MAIWLLVFGFMAFIMTAMAVGVLVGRKPIAGSCGGLNQIGMKDGCDICGGKDKVCEEENRKQGTLRRASDESRGADLGYNAVRR
ncbi:(Na+)-NQR maturation NqrM [Vreelandella sp. EE22]